MSKVSIVVASYGRETESKELVQSCRKAFKKNEYEIIFVCSDPIDSDKIEWLRNQQDVRLICMNDREIGSKRKKSLYYYQNIGCRNAKGEWIFISNDDAELTQEAIKEFNEIESEYDILIVPTHIGDVNFGTQIPLCGDFLDNQGEKNNLFLMDFIFIRNEAFWAIGGLDEKIDWYGAGIDLSIRTTCYSRLRIGKLENFITHKISENNRTISHALIDFAYINRKFNLPRANSDSINLNIYWGKVPKNIWVAKILVAIYRAKSKIGKFLN